MANSKLLETIHSLSEDEKLEFQLFLKSPFFLPEAMAEGFLRLFNGLLATETPLGMVMADKQALHAGIYPAHPYSAVRLERAFTKLIRLVEQFLAVKNYLREDNRQRRDIDLASVYRAKRAASLYTKHISKLKKANEKNPIEPTDHYFLRYELASEEFEWNSTFNKAKGDLGLPAVIEQLDLFYQTKRTELVNIFIQQKIACGLRLDDITLQLSTALASPPQHELKHPLLLITKRINELIQMPSPGVGDFEHLFDLIKAHESRFQAETIKTFAAFLRNFCTVMYDSGRSELLGLLHRIHQDHFERGYFHYAGQITTSSLLNIVAVAIKAKNAAWATQILEENRHNILAGDDAEEIFRVNKALCLFEAGKFEEALETTAFPASYPVYLLFSRRLELKAYYELRSPLLPYKIDAYRKFLERAAPLQVSGVHRVSNMNFVHILSQLSRSRPITAKRAARILQRIKEKKHLSERNWLLEKAREGHKE